MAIVIFAILVAVIWLVANSTRNRGPDRGSSTEGPEGARAESAVAILERRLAEGEISIEDYENRRRVLLETASGAQADPHRTVARTAGGS